MEKNQNYFDMIEETKRDFLDQGRNYRKKVKEYEHALRLFGGIILGYGVYMLLCFLLEIFK